MQGMAELLQDHEPSKPLQRGDIVEGEVMRVDQDGILVNSIAPGSISHPGGSWERFQRESPPEAVKNFIERNLPMGKFGWAEPLGDLVAFLASERAGLVTGACIVIDGGQSHSMI